MSRLNDYQTSPSPVMSPWSSHPVRQVTRDLGPVCHSTCHLSAIIRCILPSIWHVALATSGHHFPPALGTSFLQTLYLFSVNQYNEVCRPIPAPLLLSCCGLYQNKIASTKRSSVIFFSLPPPPPPPPICKILHIL